jgi:hypothetical protein
VVFDNANTVSGSVNASLAGGTDSMVLDNGSNIAGNLTATGVNFYNQGPTDVTTVEGSVTLTGRENLSNTYLFDFGAVLGNVIINSGNGFVDVVDVVDFDILGNFIANMAGGVNVVTLNSGSSVNGNVYVTGSSGVDALTLASDSAVLGNVTANLGNGINTMAILVDTFVGGNQITYIGGNQADSFTFLGTAPGARLTALMGNGIDVITLDTATAVFGSAYFDFGSGADLFVSPNPIATPITIRNLP